MYPFQMLPHVSTVLAQNTPTASASGWLWYLLLVPVIGGAAAVLNLLLGQIWPRITARRDKRSLEKNLTGTFYSLEDIKRSRYYYQEPFVQVVDPMGSEEPRALAGVKSKLYGALDELLDPHSEYRYIILLADSGMGKTCALMNYTIRQIRRLRKDFDVKLIPLSSPNAMENINEHDGKQNVVLFLDAFDEDIQAIRDHQVRLADLMKAAQRYRRVVISCRTQFFRTDEEIPKEVGTLKVAPRAAGEPAEYIFYKLYLSPFTEKQAKRYLRHRYPLLEIPSLPHRWRALEMVDKIPHLATRPLLLSHIEVLVKDSNIRYAFEIYEEMVNSWLKREEGFIGEQDQLRRFSELLAIELYLNRAKRGAEHIPRFELSQLAMQWGIPIEDRQLSDHKFSTRSLLNRDADGNYKFAHRSIMEYLYVNQYAHGEDRCVEVEWTDQMLTFYWEMLEKHIVAQRTLPFNSPNSVGSFSLNQRRQEFLRDIIKHGLSMLRSPKIAQQRLDSILEVATALIALLIDPAGVDDPVVSLISVKKGFHQDCDLSLIAIHYGGKLLDTKDTAVLRRYKQPIEIAFYGDQIPDMGDESFVRTIGWFRRVWDGLDTFMIPIMRNGEMPAVLIGETSRSDAFRNDPQLKLIDTLRLLGKYLREYR